ncbi:MAG: recombinase family protein [Pirellulaceae bacterium]
MIAKNEKPRRAACYVRMSTDKQEDSPRQQKQSLEQLAVRHNCRVVKEYQDSGISGDEFHKRKALQQMLADAQAGKFDVVLAWDQDRLSRADLIDVANVVGPLRGAGVELITVAQGLINLNDFAGQMAFMANQGGKHQFLRDNGRNILRARMSRIETGAFATHVPPGMCRVYKSPDGKEQVVVEWDEVYVKAPRSNWVLTIEPSRREDYREAVLWAFNEYASRDCTLRELADGMYARGLGRKTGRPFGSCAVRRMLSSPKYIGTLEIGKYRRGKYHRIDDDGGIAAVLPGVPKVSGAPAMTIAHHHEPLVSEKLFSCVQSKLEERLGKRRKRRGNRHYIATPLLHCGHCGSPMYGASQTHRANSAYYSCYGDCPGQISSDIVDAAISEYLRANLLNEESRQYIRERIREVCKSKRRKSAKGATERQLEQVEKQLARARKRLAICDDEDLPDVQGVIRDLRERQASLSKEVKGMKAANPSDAEARALLLLDDLDAAMRAGDPAVVSNCLARCFSSITVWLSKKELGDGRRVERMLFEHRHADMSAKRTVQFIPTVDSVYRQPERDAAKIRAAYNGEALTTKEVAAIIGCREIASYRRLSHMEAKKLMAHVGYNRWAPIVDGVVPPKEMSDRERVEQMVTQVHAEEQRLVLAREIADKLSMTTRNASQHLKRSKRVTFVGCGSHGGWAPTDSVQPANPLDRIEEVIVGRVAAGKAPVRAGDIAKELGLSRVQVSNRLQTLEAVEFDGQGWVPVVA